MTFSNPLIILLFLATFAQFAFIIPEHPVQMSLGYLSIIAGALLWWYGLTWLIDKIREYFSINGIVIINRIIGTIVMVFSFGIYEVVTASVSVISFRYTASYILPVLYRPVQYILKGLIPFLLLLSLLFISAVIMQTRNDQNRCNS